MALPDARDLLSTMFRAAVAAADPARVVPAHLPPRPRGRTVVVGAGKAAAGMAAALDAAWDGPLEGAVVTRHGAARPAGRIAVLEAGHPLPDEAGLVASQRLLDTVRGLSADDLVIALISGGGSALLPAPPQGLTLEDEIAINRALLASGAPISAMNTVRKHLSVIKGGRLAAATRARVHTLVISDVPDDNAAQVASGPTLPDGSTRQDALDVVSLYGLDLPVAALRHLRSPEADAPRPDDPGLAANTSSIIASAALSLDAAADMARARGLQAHILSSSIEGEAAIVGQVHAAITRQIAASGQPFATPCVLLSGGETTVTVHNPSGLGGRNGEFALGFALAIDGMDGVTLLAADTDGIDGGGDNAGVFADGGSARRLRALGHDPRLLLQRNESHAAFAALGELFVTGPTGTNVNDFRAILIAPGG